MPAGVSVQNPFTVTYEEADGTAIIGEDYNITATTGTLSFPAGAEDGDAQTFTIDILEDLISEPTEIVNIRVTEATEGVQIARPEGF